MSGKIGIIGGSGVYKIDGIKKVRNVRVKTPFGDPSDAFLTGELKGMAVVFLARHGRGHRLLPGEINYPANIYGMKKLGVERIISVSACGSLKEALKPLDIVIPDQFVDRTNQARPMTFFGEGVVAHVALADPTCPELSRTLYDAGCGAGVTMHLGGTYLNMEGPQFSTKAESNLYRSWDMDIIGMTNMAEAKLAREAEICYASLACVTDYDCWHMDESTQTVSVEMIVQNLMKNIENSKAILKAVMPKLKAKATCACRSALRDAIITDPGMMPAKTKKKLALIMGKYMR